MASVNRVQILGRLGEDPEIKYTQSGVPTCTVSVCTDEKVKQADGTYQNRPEWHRIVCWSKTAENVCKFLRKGSQIYVEGKLQTRKWQDQQGQDRYVTEIVAQNVQFLDSKRDDQGGNNPAQGGSYYDQQPQQGGQQAQGQAFPQDDSYFQPPF